MNKTLRLEDDAIQRCVGICNTMIDQLDDALKKTNQLSKVSGFGGFDSAVELQDKYHDKLNGGAGSGSVVERLRQFRDTIMVMRDTFAAGGDAFADADSAIRAALTSVQGEVG